MLTIREIGNYLPYEKREEFNAACSTFNLEEEDLEIAPYYHLKQEAKEPEICLDQSVYKLIKLPATFSFVLQDDKRYGIFLTQQGIEKYKEYFLFPLLPSAIHAGHFNVARYIIKEKENSFSPSSIILTYISYMLLENFENPPEDLQNILNNKLIKIIAEAALKGQLIDLLNIDNYDGIKRRFIKNLLTNIFANNNPASIDLLANIITAVALNGQLIILLSMDSNDMGCSFITNLLGNACANKNQTSIDLLKYVITAAVLKGQLIDLLNMKNERGRRFIANLLTDARANNNQTSIDLLMFIITAAAHGGQLTSLLSVNSNNIDSNNSESRFVINLLSDACANKNKTSINLLKHAITEAALKGQLIDLLSMDNNGVECRFIKNLLSNACAHKNQTSINLLKHAITEAACNSQLISLLSMDSDGTKHRFIANLLGNAHANKNQTSIDLLKHTITEAARKDQLIDLLSMDSDGKGRKFVKNLLANACANNNPASIDLLANIITAAALKGQLINLLGIDSDGKGRKFITNLLADAQTNNNNNQASIDLLANIITAAAHKGQLIDLLSMDINGKGYKFITNLLINACAHNNKTSINLLMSIITASKGQLINLLSIDSDGKGCGFITDLLTNACANKNQASINLLKHAIMEAAQNKQLTNLFNIKMNNNGKKFIENLVNIFFSKKRGDQQLSIKLLDYIAEQINSEETELRKQFYNCILCTIKDPDQLKIINQMMIVIRQKTKGESPFLKLIKEQYKRETGRKSVPIRGDEKILVKQMPKMGESTNQISRIIQQEQSTKWGERIKTISSGIRSY